jgi:hypothetical protein
MTEESSSGDIPAPVRSFLRTHVDSVGLLEVLLFLHAHPSRAWTPAELNAELRSNLSSIAFRLARLRTLGLASQSAPPESAYRYAPSSPSLAATVDALAATYRQYRLRIIDLLLSKLDQLKNFSDSFRLWEEKEDHE